MIDLVDWCGQIGILLLPRSRGVPFVYPAPTAADGVSFPLPDVAETEKIMALARGLVFGD